MPSSSEWLQLAITSLSVLLEMAASVTRQVVTKSLHLSIMRQTERRNRTSRDISISRQGRQARPLGPRAVCKVAREQEMIMIAGTWPIMLKYLADCLEYIAHRHYRQPSIQPGVRALRSGTYAADQFERFPPTHLSISNTSCGHTTKPDRQQALHALSRMSTGPRGVLSHR